MAAIYTRASNVLVWLGQAVENLIDLRNVVRALGQSRNPGFVDHLQHLRGPLWAAERLIEFTSAEWFYRVWTMQELGLADKAILWCGEYRPRGLLRAALNDDKEFPTVQFDWTDVVKAFEQAKELFPSGLDILGSGFDDSHAKIMALNRWQRAATTSFLDVLDSVRSQDTSDPRDRIFALLSHPKAWLPDENTNEPRLLMEPDYKLTWLEAYLTCAKTIIVSHNNLDVLSYIDTESYDREDMFLPSWVPNWREGRREHRLVQEEFTACGQPGASLHTAPTATFIDGVMLCTTGVYLGFVTYTYPARHNSVDSWLAYQPQHTTKNPQLRSLVDEVAFREAAAFLRQNWSSHNYFMTDSGISGIGPPSMVAGHRVFVLNGGRVPYILAYNESRRTSAHEREALVPGNPDGYNKYAWGGAANNALTGWEAEQWIIDSSREYTETDEPERAVEHHYRLVGECYLDGYMHGEAVDGVKQKVNLV